MKTNSDQLRLLNAALADETWHSCHERLRSDGLATLQAAKRSRSRRILSAQISALVLVLAAAWWNLSPRTVFSSLNAARAGDASRSISRPSEAQFQVGERPFGTMISILKVNVSSLEGLRLERA